MIGQHSTGPAPVSSFESFRTCFENIRRWGSGKQKRVTEEGATHSRQRRITETNAVVAGASIIVFSTETHVCVTDIKRNIKEYHKL